MVKLGERAGYASILVLVEEKVLMARVIRPDIFDSFIEFSVVFQFVEVIDHFGGGAGADGIVNQFFLSGRPRWPRRS